MKTIEVRDEISTINNDINEINQRLDIIENTLIGYSNIFDQLQELTDMLNDPDVQAEKHFS